MSRNESNARNWGLIYVIVSRFLEDRPAVLNNLSRIRIRGLPRSRKLRANAGANPRFTGIGGATRHLVSPGYFLFMQIQSAQRLNRETRFPAFDSIDSRKERDGILFHAAAAAESRFAPARPRDDRLGYARISDNVHCLLNVHRRRPDAACPE